MSITKELRQELRRLEREGWRYSFTNHTHIRIDGPNGEVVYCGGTLSDWRAIHNIRARIRRAQAGTMLHGHRHMRGGTA